MPQWCYASTFREFRASVSQLQPFLTQLLRSNTIHWILGPDRPLAATGLPLVCAGLANGYRIVAEQPRIPLRLSENVAEDFATLTMWLHLSVGTAVGGQLTTADALTVAQRIAKTGLLSAFASVCSVIANHLWLLRHHQHDQPKAQHALVQQQQQQQQPARKAPKVSSGVETLVDSLLHVWDLLQSWWPGKKLSGARGLAVTVQPFAELLVAILHIAPSFGEPTLCKPPSSNHISAADAASWLLGHPASKAINSADVLLRIILREADARSSSIPQLQQLLSSTAIQMLTATHLGLSAQLQHDEAQGRSAVAALPSTAAAAAGGGGGHASSAGGCAAQQLRHLGVPAHHLLLWDALQLPVEHLADASAGDAKCSMGRLLNAATTVFCSSVKQSARQYLQHQEQLEQQQQQQQIAPVASAAAGMPTATCISSSEMELPHVSSSSSSSNLQGIGAQGSSSSSSSNQQGIGAQGSSSIAGCQVPYLQLLLVAVELQLLNPHVSTTQELLLLMEQLLYLHGRSTTATAAANVGLSSIQTQVVQALLGSLGLGVRHAYQRQSSCDINTPGTEVAAVVPEQQQQRQRQQQTGSDHQGAQPVLPLQYGRLLLSVFKHGLERNWSAVLAQDPITSLKNLELGLRAQAEARCLLDRQQQAAAAGMGAPEASSAGSSGPERLTAVTTLAMAEQKSLARDTFQADDVVCALYEVAAELSEFLESTQHVASSAADQESAAATAEDPRQVFAAVMSVLTSNLKMQQTLVQSRSDLTAAIFLFGHAAVVLSALARLECELQPELVGTWGYVHSHPWGSCINLAARSCIAAGGSLAAMSNSSAAAGMDTQDEYTSGVDTDTCIPQLQWLYAVQHLAKGAGWVYEQLSLLLSLTEGVATDDQQTATAAAAAGVSSSSSTVGGSQLGTANTATGNQRVIKVSPSVEQLSRMEEQCSKVLQQLTDVLESIGEVGDAADSSIAFLSSSISLDLAHQLQQLGSDLCAVIPVPYCCNNPGCCSFRGESEQQLVSGKGCVCGGCQVARYCGRDCQAAHWQQHKAVCKKLKRQRRQQQQAQGASIQCLPPVNTTLSALAPQGWGVTDIEPGACLRCVDL